MKLISCLANTGEDKVIAENCTLGQVFTMIDDWCINNNANYNWESACKYPYIPSFGIECFDLDTNEYVGRFEIEEE